MNGQDIGRWLIEFGFKIIEIFREVWRIMSLPITVGKIEIFGVLITEGYSFTPIQATPFIGGVIVVIALVSLFWPTH
jgi:hypothetical protein